MAIVPAERQVIVSHPRCVVRASPAILLGGGRLARVDLEFRALRVW